MRRSYAAYRDLRKRSGLKEFPLAGGQEQGGALYRSAELASGVEEISCRHRVEDDRQRPPN
jgi:hypothetical protein